MIVNSQIWTVRQLHTVTETPRDYQKCTGFSGRENYIFHTYGYPPVQKDLVQPRSYVFPVSSKQMFCTCSSRFCGYWIYTLVYGLQ